MNHKKEDLSKVLDKLIESLAGLKGKAVSEDIRGMAQKLSDAIEIHNLEGDDQNDFIDFDEMPEILGSNFLSGIIEGIKKKKVLEIYYQPFYEDKPYFIRVHPYLLKEYRFRWYLIGLNVNKKELRTYALDRIWEIKETDLPYIQRTFNARDYFKNTVGIISPPGEPPRIQIKVNKPQAHYLITQPLHPSQSIESEDDEHILFNYRVHPTYEFKSLLLGLGSDVEILKPPDLRKDIVREIERSLKKYQ